MYSSRSVFTCRKDLHPIIWVCDILLWIGYQFTSLLKSSCIYCLSATYLTEPGVIPKGAPLTPAQVLNISETPGKSLRFPLGIAQRMLHQLFICITDGNYTRFDSLLLQNHYLVALLLFTHPLG